MVRLGLYENQASLGHMHKVKDFMGNDVCSLSYEVAASITKEGLG